ncbi:hypothetical protein H0H87_003870 [Tephrocybe sp. NHM501043]|nr:hypothetical protein H0H87_003870 [Tephrocybe sp. NHM501043]
MPRKDAPAGPISAQAQQDIVSEGIENFELPKSLVTKIAKSALPDNAKLQKETVLSLLKGSTVFINYLVLTHSALFAAATAHDVAISKQHKSISASDVLKALEMIEFGDLVDKLQAELVVYRAQSKTDKKKPTSAVPSASTAAHPPASSSSTFPPSISVPLRKSTKASSSSKDKDAAALPPFTSAPLVPQERDVEAREREQRMDVDWEEELGEAMSAAASSASAMIASSRLEEDEPLEEQNEEDEEGDEEEEEEDDEGDEEAGGEGEVVEDPMEVEEAELRRDAMGLNAVDGAPGPQNGVGVGAEEEA